MLPVAVVSSAMAAPLMKTARHANVSRRGPVPFRIPSTARPQAAIRILRKEAIYDEHVSRFANGSRWML